MEKLELKITDNSSLLVTLRKELPFFSNYQIEKVLKDKNVKLNGKRVCKEGDVKVGDVLEVYYNIKERPWFETVYEDDNILIINKKSGIEVISETDRDIFSILKKTYSNIYVIHRIDRNTEGLVVFAKNQLAEQELLGAFKQRTLTKKYLLECVGEINVDSIKPRLFLKKLADESKVIISEVKTTGYDEIKTIFKFVKRNAENTILEAELITGKTHQIRAHISYYGHYIVGDGKYGKGNGKLHLTAYYIKFRFNNKSPLSYLNEKSFEILPTWL